nr:hypothetical protein HmN_000739800 [Hymenolepis microstoma]
MKSERGSEDKALKRCRVNSSSNDSSLPPDSNIVQLKFPHPPIPLPISSLFGFPDCFPYPRAFPWLKLIQVFPASMTSAGESSRVAPSLQNAKVCIYFRGLKKFIYFHPMSPAPRLMIKSLNAHDFRSFEIQGMREDTFVNTDLRWTSLQFGRYDMTEMPVLAHPDLKTNLRCRLIPQRIENHFLYLLLPPLVTRKIAFPYCQRVDYPEHRGRV